MGIIQKLGKSLLYSEKFQDIYWSKEGGLEEKNYVFLEGNSLSDRWSNMEEENFRIFELGFGAGLNLFATWMLWKAHKRPGITLEYYSTEKFPIPYLDLQDVLQDFPAIKELVDAFLEKYSDLSPGINTFSFPEDQITVFLFNGDCFEYLKNLSVPIDVWYPDGFSPSKNPDLWSEEIFRLMYEKSKENASFATYSVSSSVQENALSAGFIIEKRKGFGTKRGMLYGNKKDWKGRNLDIKKYFKFPEKRTVPGATVAILGGGISGTSIAYSFGKRGISAKIIEQNSGLGLGASGNPAGIFAPNLTSEKTSISQLTLTGNLYLNEEVELLSRKGIELDFHKIGVFQVIGSEQEFIRIKKALDSHNLKNDFAEILDYKILNHSQTSKLNGVLFKKSGWLNPHQFTKAIAHSENLTTLDLNQKITSIERVNGKWKLLNEKNESIFESEILILANSDEANSFLDLQWLSLKSIRGQICFVPPSDFPIELHHVIIHEDGYVIPGNDKIVVGATYNHGDRNPDLNPKHNMFLAENLLRLFPSINVGNFHEYSGRVGFRSVAKDLLPVSGPVPVYKKFVSSYAGINKNSLDFELPEPDYFPDLYIHAGMGSRGLVFAPALAENLVRQILSEKLLFTNSVIESVLPARFIMREIFKNQIPKN